MEGYYERLIDLTLSRDVQGIRRITSDIPEKFRLVLLSCIRGISSDSVVNDEIEVLRIRSMSAAERKEFVRKAVKSGEPAKLAFVLDKIRDDDIKHEILMYPIDSIVGDNQDMQAIVRSFSGTH